MFQTTLLTILMLMRWVACCGIKKICPKMAVQAMTTMGVVPAATAALTMQRLAPRCGTFAIRTGNVSAIKLRVMAIMPSRFLIKATSICALLQPEKRPHLAGRCPPFAVKVLLPSTFHTAARLLRISFTSFFLMTSFNSLWIALMRQRILKLAIPE
jgi:hypothetical protein